MTYKDFEASQLDQDDVPPEGENTVERKKASKAVKGGRKGADEEAKDANLPPNECVLHIHALMHVAKEEVQMMKCACSSS